MHIAAKLIRPCNLPSTHVNQWVCNYCECYRGNKYKAGSLEAIKQKVKEFISCRLYIHKIEEQLWD